jgi:hypothetical protein
MAAASASLWAQVAKLVFCVGGIYTAYLTQGKKQLQSIILLVFVNLGLCALMLQALSRSTSPSSDTESSRRGFGI